MKIFAKFLCFLVLTACVNVLGEVAIKRSQVGNISIGVHKSNLMNHYKGRISETLVYREGDPQPALELVAKNNHVITLELDEAENVWAIRIEDPYFKTELGIGVGNSFAEVREKYPKAKLDYGVEEGGYLSLYITELNGFFSFDITNLPSDILSAKVLDEKAIGFIKANMVILHNISSGN